METLNEAQIEDYLLEEGLERLRELREVEDMQEDEIDDRQEVRFELMRRYDNIKED